MSLQSLEILITMWSLQNSFLTPVKLALVISPVAMTALSLLVASPIWSPALLFALLYPTIALCACIGGCSLGALASVLSGTSLILLSSYQDQLTPNNSLAIALALLFGGLSISALCAQLIRQVRQSDSEQLSYLRAFIEHAPAAIAMFDRNMTYLAASKRWVSNFKIEGTTIVGRCHYDIFPDLPDRWVEVHRRCLEGAVESKEQDLFIRADGSNQWLSWEVQPWMTTTEKSEIGGIIIFSEDITALKEIHERESALRASTEVQTALRLKAEEENKTKDVFVATLSHELRSPLNAILGWIQLAKRTPHDLARRERAFGAIEHSAQLLARLISDILDISRITSRKLRLDIQDVSVETVLERSFEIALPLAQSKGIQLTGSNLQVEASLRADSERLQQSLSNLLANAVKFTPQGGHITLSSRVLDHTIQITVCDDGQGISPEMLPHIFERFVQADLSSTRVHGGLGLGLAITRHLIELQGGTVTAHSEGEGKGSTFTVTLPLLSEQQEAPALASASSTLESPADCVGRTIVIVDDEFEARELLRGVLEDHGAQVFSAGSAREGFDLVTSCAPDLVISDIAMPYRDGYAFIQEVRNAGLSIPAIALSARAGDSFRHKALETGFNVHLAKPIEMGELLQTITALLREHTRPCSEGLRAHA